jgi:ABC-2 type transport system ATP-binding protein
LMPHREITVTVRDDEAAESIKSLVSDIPGVVNVTTLEPKAGCSRVRIDFTGDDDGVAAINQKLHSASIAILGFTEETKDLESMFMRVTKGIVT